MVFCVVPDRPRKVQRERTSSTPHPMSSPVQALEALNEALEILENALEPLFEKPLSETIDSHEQLEQAKLCAMIPYIINELITSMLMKRIVCLF
jgi:hypothetical protein